MICVYRSYCPKRHIIVTYGLKTAIITHGATAVSDAAQKRKKRILNDPIAVGLHDSQVKIITFDEEWDTGICVQPIEQNQDGETLSKINEYVRKVIGNFSGM